MRGIALSRAIVGAAAALVALGSGGRPDPRLATPKLATPTRFLEIRGALDPGIALRLFVEYQTSAKACRLELNRLEGVESDRIFRREVSVEVTPAGYLARAPLDLVPPGECGWRAWGVEYVALVDGKSHAIPVPPSPIVWFRDGAASGPPPIRIACGPQKGPRAPFSTAGEGPQCEESGGGDRFVAPEAGALELDVVRAVAR